jgi:hypothetical protein
VESHLVRKAVQDYRWIRSDEFEAFEFTPADEASMNQMLGITQR